MKHIIYLLLFFSTTHTLHAQKGKFTETDSIKGLVIEGRIKGKKKVNKWTYSYLNGQVVLKVIYSYKGRAESIDFSGIEKEGVKVYEKSTVQDTATYQTGTDAWIQHFRKEIEYPLEAARKGVDGDVTISFTVWEDGTIGNIELAPGSESKEMSLYKESAKVLLSGGVWNPAKIDGKNVASRNELTFVFKLK